MATFAPVYRLPPSQRSFLTREVKRQRKRKRSGDDANADDHESSEEDSPKEDDDGGTASPKQTIVRDQPRVLHPVNKRDPYYVAGLSRDAPLPGGNFPHAAIPDEVREKTSIEQELSRLNPPIYVPKHGSDDPGLSLRGRHLNNLTAILHKCMLNQDWKRASRVWGLILRTEIGGYAPDIRQHGRWMVGAEILMRRDQTSGASTSSITAETASTTAPVIPDEGFQLARDYYERMCLQYPHMARAHHASANAYAIYPALFSIWVYEVQDRSKRARQIITAAREEADSEDDDSMHSLQSEFSRQLHQIRTRELRDAAPLVRRLDDLLSNPPYDACAELLELRGMISLWLANLQDNLAELKSTVGIQEEGDDVNAHGGLLATQHHSQAERERCKAREAFQRVVNKGSSLLSENQMFLDGDISTLDGDDG